MPEHRPPCDELLEFLKPYDAAIAQLALDVRDLVLTEAPTATEIVYDGYNAVALGYTFTGRFNDAFCHVAVYSGHVNLGFNHGAKLDDQARLLQGTGKQVRHLTIEKADDLERPHVRRFLRAAMRQVGQAGMPAQEADTVPVTVVKASAKKRRPKRKS
jgi:hypothetical protein